MKNTSKYKIDISIILCIILFAFISIVTIGSAENLLAESSNLVLKQIIWYIIGFIVVFFVMFIGNHLLYKNSWFLYAFGVLLLILVLFFGKEINHARCWFQIKGIGTFQPSEFMKIILIITLGKMIDKFKTKYNNPTLMEEFKFLLKVAIVVGIPSVLTFLEPDTGVVLIYLLITIVMLFIAGIRYRWFGILFGILLGFIATVLITYFINNDLFISIFGSSFFLRVDRLLDWSSGIGYQLENGITSIGSGGLLGYGINNTPIYFPEPQTDFIFAVFANNFGFFGSTTLLVLLTFFDLKLVKLAIESPNNTNKYVISGIIGMLIYQQLQNIGMTIGIMPITGITLPFISYGGSSLISYMIMLGIILNISNENIRYRN